MKIQSINEFKQGSSFKYTVIYPLSDFKKWMDIAKKEQDFTFDKQGQLTLIYLNDKHIGTFNHKNTTLYTDKYSIFGN